MDFRKQVINLFDDLSDENYFSLAMDLFHYQAEHNIVYSKYLQLIHCKHEDIKQIEDIPLLPISLYKHLEIKTGNWKEEKIFLSSGTTQMERSRNYIKDLSWYDLVSLRIFQSSIGLLNDYAVFGLLPSYIENPASSLIHMVDHFGRKNNSTEKANILSDFDRLYAILCDEIKKSESKILLIGVTFALLDFAEKFSIDNPNLEIMFTGGMKNRKKELSYQEIYRQLSSGFPASKIYGEYGMTELSAQAYSIRINRYQMNACIRIIPKEITDPLSTGKIGKTGRLGIIDLSNIDTCAFILSDDLGRVFKDEFEIIGRLDYSDLRGCNMLFQSS